MMLDATRGHSNLAVSLLHRTDAERDFMLHAVGQNNSGRPFTLPGETR
jgi:hypothetical protein